MKSYFFYTDQLTVGYDGKPLIKEINIQLNKGEILTLIGPNGAGKSTILKSITRQLSLISGTVYLEQEQMSRMTNREVSKKLAVVLTERMRPELMTCEDVVSTGRYPYTGTLGILSAEDKEKVKSAMEMVHAWDLKDRDFTAISDGQRQRILLARAICQEPEIIILDEPTSFLDIRHKLELLAILKKMVLEKQMTVIMSLHELDLAQKISDQVICVHGDHIEKYGAPEEIFTSDYIRKLYGITRGSYNAEFGCVEMEPPAGKPEVFVIGGNGSGIPVYRKLQRQGIPFVTGVLHTNDADYQVAYSVDVEGNPIYTDEMTDDEKFDAALQASLGYFEAAGYTVEDGKLTAAPEGAKLTYEMTIGASGSGDHPSFAILTDAKAALESIGFTLEINDVTDSNIMWDALNAGTAEMWAAAWQATIDPDMYQTYHSESVKSNYYHINDATLDQDIIDARSSADQEYRKSVYKQCLDIILDWAVEIPVYQRQNCIIYSPERVNADTFTKDVSTFYYWYKDIENIEMN